MSIFFCSLNHLGKEGKAKQVILFDPRFCFEWHKCKFKSQHHFTRSTNFSYSVYACVCVCLWERERESNSIRKINDVTHWPACIQYLQYLSIVNWCLIMDSWFTSQQLKHFWLWFWIDIRVSLTKKSSIWILKTPIRRFRLFCMSWDWFMNIVQTCTWEGVVLDAWYILPAHFFIS